MQKNNNSHLAFIFPGQGSQYVGMGQEIANTYPQAAKLFNQADEILGTSLSNLCWNGPKEALDQTYNTQPAIFVTCLACLAGLQAAGYKPTPKFVAGHSLGEYVAYYAAGVLSFEDGLKLVRTRAQLMEQAGQQNPGKMAAIIHLDDEKTNKICQSVSAQNNSDKNSCVQIANYNAPGQVIISGNHKSVDEAIEKANKAGARKIIPLAVSIPAHTQLMETIKTDFSNIVNSLSLNEPTYPIIANITAQPLDSIKAIKTEMIEQLTASVQWTKSVEFMLNHGITQFVEIGPKKTLTNLIKRIDRKATRLAVEDIASINQMINNE